MARVPYLDKSDLAPENHDLLARNITLHRALANSPNGLRAFGALGQFIRHKSRLDPRLLEPLAKLVLTAAREMTHDLAISEATFAALRKDLDNERVVDLVITISFYNAVVRLLASLQIDVEPEYQHYLEEFSLPAAGKGKA